MAYEISVFLENKITHFEKITGILKSEKINIRSISLNSILHGWGVLHLLVSNPEKAYQLLSEKGNSVVLREVIALEMKDEAGGLDELLVKVPISQYANGFAPGRSIVTNASPHVNADLIVNMDLKDFFPTISYKRVWGMFKKLGFSDQNATVLALICTEPVEEKVEVDGEIYYISEGERVLPQGAPTSPAITNIICRRMDQRMAGIAKKLDFTYTRYADDMTFSGPESSRQNLQKLLWQTKGVIKDEDFQIHPGKTRMMSNGNRKEVTGIIVNEKTTISRKKLKAFRALLFQIEKDGPKGKTWGESPDLMASILGFARYVYMVDKEKGKPLLERVKGIRQVYVPKKTKTRGIENKPWWKFW